MKKSKTIRQLQVVIIALAISFASLTKAVVIYDESVSGDSQGGQLFSLTNGSNIFVGSQAWGDAVDGFRFIVPNGTQATIQMNYTYSNLPAGEAMATEWDLLQLRNGVGSCTVSIADSLYKCSGTGPDSNGSTYITLFTANSEPGFGLPATPLGPALNTVVLGSGTYVFNDNYRFATSLAGTAGLLTYSIDVEQTAVPLPSAVFLFGAGLMALVGATQQRKIV